MEKNKVIFWIGLVALVVGAIAVGASVNDSRPPWTALGMFVIGLILLISDKYYHG